MQINKISKKQLQVIVSDEKINFIASAITPWHAIGVNTTISRLSAEGFNVNPLFVILVSPNNSYLLNSSSFNYNTKHVYHLDYSNNNNSKFKLLVKPFVSIINFLKNPSTKASSRLIYVVSPWYPDFTKVNWLFEKMKNINVKYCVIDEGVATYLSSSNPIYRSFLINKSILKSLLFIYTFFVQNVILYKFIYKSRSFVNMNLFIQNRTKLELNNIAVFHYRQFLKSDVLDISMKTSGNLNSTVVIATMAFSRKHIYYNEDINLLKKLITFINSKGLTPIIKPHPREYDYKVHYADLDCDILDNINLPLEKIFNSKSKPLALISFSSTSLINAKLFYGINSISIIDLLNLNHFDKIYRDEMSSFRKTFNSQLSFPKSLDQINLI